MGDTSSPPIPATSSLGRNSFAGWRDYPANLATYDPLITDGYGLSGRLLEKASQLFKGDSEAMAVELFEIAGHESAEVLTPDFLTNLFACGEHPQASDAGSGNFTFHPLASGGHDMALTMDLEDAAEYRLSFETLQSLRHLSDKNGLAILIQAAADRADRTDFSSKTDFADKNSRYPESDALNMRSQATAADLNKYMLGLTKKSVDDSATVRVVGIVSLIYLPATFTATILGMDFFTFEISTSSIGIAKDFWVYLVISIPLTVLTVGWWVVLLARKKARKAALEPQGTEKSTGALGV
ncbi:MAG: hypothetical protein ASARMPREDX12_004507 [Alectoria sarmentosa]|nr:MAG: hypothetical protein ASARMPREDX12_004507 [Alectoria sarmentosa]